MSRRRFVNRGGADRHCCLGVIVIACTAFQLAVPSLAASDPMPQVRARANPLTTLNRAVRELSEQVIPSVVEIRASGFRPIDEASKGQADLVLGARDAAGSGTIVDSTGYVLASAHLVAGAETIQVLLHSPVKGGTPSSREGEVNPRTLEARVVGIASDVDLALLKIDATGLVPLRLADSSLVRQGDIVFAFGNPEGLSNSMTMGIVSAVARQLDNDSPNVYIQTDAPTNPGSSGGPLVNADGELVGINTLIVSDSGGSQGLGLAIPSAVIAVVYPQLREYGRVQRGAVGIQVQGITTALAAGLGLARTSGVVISDVAPDSPADGVGVQVQDIVLAMDGHAVLDVPSFVLQSYGKSPGELVTLNLLRGSSPVAVTIRVAERTEDGTSDNLANAQLNSLPSLGIVASEVTARTLSTLAGLRIQSGVLVVARDRRSLDREVLLVPGDVIHAVGTVTVRSVDALQILVNGFKRSADIVLQIERDGRLRFVTQKVF